MKAIFVLGIALLSMITGCMTSGGHSPPDHASLTEFAPDNIHVAIVKREWGGFWGREGYIGFEQNSYGAYLRGRGPIFTNPTFYDNPSEFRCIGTITLDRDLNKVVVNIRRIVSKPGQAEKTQPHPANGTYPIQSIRKPGDPWLE